MGKKKKKTTRRTAVVTINTRGEKRSRVAQIDHPETDRLKYTVRYRLPNPCEIGYYSIMHI